MSVTVQPVWILLALGAAWNCGAALQKRGSMLTPQEAQRIAVEKAKAAGYPASVPMTPPIPARWPPAGETRVSYFIYARRSLPTSTVRFEVYSPHLRVDIDLKAPSEPVVAPLRQRLLATEAQRPGSARAAAELLEAQAALFDAVRAGAIPSGETASRVQAAYRGWMTANPSLAQELRQLAPDFSKWIEEQ